jgi:hypothetical protein
MSVMKDQITFCNEIIADTPIVDIEHVCNNRISKSKEDDRTTKHGLLSVKSSRLITILEFIGILKKKR